jgi:hypothetical protein
MLGVNPGGDSRDGGPVTIISVASRPSQNVIESALSI